MKPMTRRQQSTTPSGTPADVAADIAKWAADQASASADQRDPRNLDRILRDQISDLARRIRECMSAPQPVEDALAGLDALIQRQGEAWLDARRLSLAQAVAARFEFTHSGDYVQRHPQFPLSVKELTIDALCALAPELIKASLERIVREEAAKREPGLPLDQREAIRQDLEAQILEIEERHAAVVEAASRLNPPIVLQLLPAVVKRREQAEQQRRQDEYRAAHPHKDWPEPAPSDSSGTRRSSESSYLQSQRTLT